MSRTKPAFVQLAPGSLVEAGGTSYQVTHLLGVDSLLARNLDTNTVERLSVDRIRALSKNESAPEDAVAGGKDLLLIDDEKWQTAQFRLSVIRPYLESDNPTRELAEELAGNAGVHTATFYRWVERYRQAGHLSGLVPDSRGRNRGQTGLAPEQEEIVNDAIERVYLTPERRPPGDVLHEVGKLCRRAGIEPPHDNTVRNRLAQIPERVCLRRRGFRERAANKFEPIKGSTEPGSCPLEFTQIDHTPFDAIVVDEEHRLPLGRPWVTMQIDVQTRVVTGAVLTLEAPSAVSVALCISRGILPKTEYLDQLGVEGDWPVWGQPGVIQSDNAKEFYSQALTKACEAYGIDLQYRPRGRPQYGGHIERLLGVTMKEFQKLPGTTFSNIRQREGYDSDKQAVFTLRELERQLIDWIVNVYHKRRHSKLDMPPLKKWEMELMGEGEGRPAGLPAVPADPERLYIDFLPYSERTVQRYGIQWDKIFYYKEFLNPWINSMDPDNPKAKRKFIVRRDPRDISVLYFFDPEDQVYYRVPYRHPGHPAVSLWELREVKAKLREEGCRDIDEDAIFEAIERMRRRTEEATEKTKKARRSRHRARRAEKVAKGRRDGESADRPEKSSGQRPASVPAGPEPAAPATDLETICTDDVQPFDMDLD